MTHETAVRIQAPARYATGDLAPGDLEQFEEHYADCSACLNEVWAASALAANAKEVFRDRHKGSAEPKPARWPWLRILPVPAFSLAFNGVLLAGLGYVLLGVVPGYRAQLGQYATTEVVEPISVRAAVRGPDAPPPIAVKGAAVDLSFDIPQVYTRYRLFITTGPGGSVVRTDEVVLTPGFGRLLRVPVSRLAPGNYELTLAGFDDQRREDIGSCIISVLHR